MKKIPLLILFNCIIASQVPHASIVNWQPGSYGNYINAGYQKPLLPIWVTISFNTETSSEFVKNYFNFLAKSNKAINQLPKEKGKGSWVIVVQPSITQAILQHEIDKANKIFDPGYKTKQEIATEEAAIRQQKAEALKAAELKISEEKLTTERLKNEAYIKAAEEARKDREEATRQYQEHLRLEQEEKQNDYELWCKNNNILNRQNEYYVQQLPINFKTFGRRPLNEYGQVAGCIQSGSDYYAAIWNPNTGMTILNQQNTVAIAVNEHSCAAVQSKFGINHQVIFWNFNNNKTFNGPLGSPLMLNNNNKILSESNDSRKSLYLWDTQNNTIESVLQKGFYLDDHNNIYSNSVVHDSSPSDYNKQGNAIFFGPFGAYLQTKDKKTPIVLANKVIENCVLANTNEVFILSCNQIIRWKDGCVISNSNSLDKIISWLVGYNLTTTSESISDFSNISNSGHIHRFKLISANSSGQLLIELSLFKNCNIKTFFFLLTPTKIDKI